MTNSKFLKIILVISGLIGIIVGAGILLFPVQFNSMSNIDLGGQVNLLNEVRASGGSLLVIGVLIFLGAFISKLTYTSTVVSVLMYLAYGFSRILSIILDGMPVQDLVIVCVFEIIIGLINVYALFKYRLKN